MKLKPQSGLRSAVTNYADADRLLRAEPQVQLHESSRSVRKPLDYTSTVLFVRDRKKPIKPFEIGLLPVKRQHAPRTVDACRESRVFNWLEEIVERFYIERV
jgi:hypothetical protein